MNLLEKLFSSDDFMPHGHCYLWEPSIVRLHVISDGLIAAAYLTIPVTLIYIARKRKDLPFDWIFACFSIFILACGASHALEIWTLWHPTYWLTGVVKAITATASLVTAGLLVKLIPQLLAIPSPSLLKERTAELSHVEREFRHTFEGAAVGIVHVDPAGPFLRVNPRFCEISGYSETELVGSPFSALAHPDDLAVELEGVRQLMSGEKSSFTMEKRLKKKKGGIIWIHLTASSVRGDDGSISYLAGFIEDISARKEAEETVRQSETRLRTLIESVKDYAIVSLDLEGHITSWNTGAGNIKGYTAQEIIGQHFSRFYPQEDIDRGKPDMELKMATEAGRFENENWRLRKDGTRFWANVIIAALRDESGHLYGYSKITRDMTERKRTEDEIEKLALVAKETDNAIVCTDSKGLIEWVNDGFTRLTGYALDEIKGRKPGSFLQGPKTSKETVRLLHERLVEARNVQVEILNYSKAGKEYWVSVRIQPVHDSAGQLKGFFAINADITQRLNDEKNERRTQRLESMGTLAGGVAHDLNNSLAPILMLCEVLRMKYPKDTAMIETVESSAQRGAGMVRQLLTFAKGSEGERISLDPGQMLRELENLMTSTFPKNIRLLVKQDASLPAVLGDPTQLHQVLLNLCVNARDAMPNGGTLTLKASFREIDAAFAASIPEAKPGRYVALRVQDSGTGIPASVLERIFDPFFTTKGPDKGTGLGLSTVIGIIRGHGGFMQVYSQPGEGTTFIAYLPINAAAVSAMQPAHETAKFHGDGGTILVVDDEPAVRMAASVVLQRLNFKVLTATDGEDGLVKVAQNKDLLVAIITDLHMPQMDGLAFVRALRHVLPEIPVIVASGRLEDSIAGDFKAMNVTARLDKPFTEAQLSAMLQGLLAPA